MTRHISNEIREIREKIYETADSIVRRYEAAQEDYEHLRRGANTAFEYIKMFAFPPFN